MRIGTVVGRMLAIALTAGSLAAPAAAGDIPGCCICEGCIAPPATQCFESPAQGCETQCSVLDCSSFADTSISCGQQPVCPGFSAPAPAPALDAAGIALAAVAMAVAARRRLR